MAKSKFDSQLSRAQYLMEYRIPTANEGRNSIEYYTNGADGKVYGIIKEGNKFYIKTTTKGNELLKENYEYIGGYMYRNENGFNSYNDATKHLELNLMSLNEAYGINKPVSTVDIQHSQKVFGKLTEEARTEMDRIRQIMENSENIGINNTGDKEAKGNSNGDETIKNNTPFEEKPSADGTKDVKETPKTAKTANAGFEDVSSPKMDDDKTHTVNGEPVKDYEDEESDLEGDYSKKPNGGYKYKPLNEGIAGFDDSEDYDEEDDEEDDEDIYNAFKEDNDGLEDNDSKYDKDEEDEEDDDFNLEDLISEEDLISGENNTLEGKGIKNPDNTIKTLNADKDNNDVKATQGDEEFMNSFDKKGSFPALSCDKLNESIERISCKMAKKAFDNESLKKKINKIVKEEAELLCWGKHPKYGKEPMTTPPNKGKLISSDDREWDDESAKGSERYGKKIGKGAPFTNAVEKLTNTIVDILKETYGLKKK